MQCECNQLPSGTFDQVCIIHSDLVSMEMEAAVLAEREACAKIAESDTSFMMLQDFGMQSVTTQVRVNIAAAIRARGE